MWETLQESWGSLLDPLHDPVTLAIPAFLTFLILEWIAARTLEHVEPGPDGRTRPRAAATRSGTHARASRWVWSPSSRAPHGRCWPSSDIRLWVYVAPWHLPADAWYTWVILLVGIDVLWYWYHRMAHRVRLVWATHQRTTRASTSTTRPRCARSGTTAARSSCGCRSP